MGERKYRGLDGTTLKKIAMLSMLIDHIGAGLVSFKSQAAVGICYRILRMAGRPAFPIYCFLLVEGFAHTRSRRNYLLRLVSFAFLSEIPFDLAFSNCWVSFEYQNVYFELSICLVMLCALEVLIKKGVRKGYRVWFIVLAAAVCSEILRADYGAIGVFFTAGFYLYRGNSRSQAAVAAILGFFESLQLTCGAAALAAPLIFVYNGRKGAPHRPLLFYGFYPLHLLMLSGVRLLWLGIYPGAGIL